MGICPDDCLLILPEEGTYGGTTYTIVLKDNPTKERKVCFRSLRDKSGLKCERIPGWGTWHKGTGACKRHGGTAGRPPVKGGEYSVMARRRLEDRIDNFLDDRENLLDLSQELATARAMFEEFIEKVQPDPDSDDYGIHLARTIKLVSTIGTLVDKISKVQSRNALSAAHVLYVRAAIADLFVKWISDPDDREAAIQDLLFRIGGDEDKDPGVVISIPSSANGS